MADVTIRALRSQLRELVDRAASGEEITVRRRGRAVARLVPPLLEARQFPDLTEFRASLQLKGEALRETVVRQRREARY